MKKLFLTLAFITVFLVPYLAQTGYQPTEENLKNREWFQDAKYGLFVHWGVYSIMGGGGDQGDRQCQQGRDHQEPGQASPAEAGAAPGPARPRGSSGRR